MNCERRKTFLFFLNAKLNPKAKLNVCVRVCNCAHCEFNYNKN